MNVSANTYLVEITLQLWWLNFDSAPPFFAKHSYKPFPVAFEIFHIFNGYPIFHPVDVPEFTHSLLLEIYVVDNFSTL